VKTQPGLLFQRHFETLKDIPFSQTWLKEQVYYDGVHKELHIPIGEVYRSYDNINQKRLILIGTRFGIVVVYDRHKDQSDNGVYYINLPHCHNRVFQVLFFASAVSFNQMKLLLGNWNEDTQEANIGRTIEEMAFEFTKE
jgi:hypothetical protein